MTTDDEDRIDFNEFIANHDHGTTTQMCGIYLQRVVRACLAHKGGGKAKGKVNLGLEIEAAMERGDNEALERLAR